MSLRSALQHVFASQAELEADEERHESAKAGCTAVRDLPDRRRSTVNGVLRSVTLRPREGVPALEAELYDGTGTVDLVWLGRREISGIEPGRRGSFEGMACTVVGRSTIYNPRYELQPRHGE
ncbi:OB-fold nucleic acid binding domain-containing protein [Cellulomonas fimi]|uniref:OB-fold nucleic acid binding domain-containing protein n=1 Tax=Cellulomonas fimi TaxID=1708 RepID=A0A7Y0LWX1_CELFI|nr:OB-fold nucleic acid binding domain-containing protein [Cellulomonas fimi]NMR19386.1 OB-fold nucleic acid binding domain-containing protein [Cellulomonas fimi]